MSLSIECNSVADIFLFLSLSPQKIALNSSISTESSPSVPNTNIMRFNSSSPIFEPRAFKVSPSSDDEILWFPLMSNFEDIAVDKIDCCFEFFSIVRENFKEWNAGSFSRVAVSIYSDGLRSFVREVSRAPIARVHWSYVFVKEQRSSGMRPSKLRSHIWKLI